jgi:hypothetical protein
MKYLLYKQGVSSGILTTEDAYYFDIDLKKEGFLNIVQEFKNKYTKRNSTTFKEFLLNEDIPFTVEPAILYHNTDENDFNIYTFKYFSSPAIIYNHLDVYDYTELLEKNWK